ncbi:helix-turn-helix domain-containing protein [Colwelliaceae bacterium BS250]
MYLSSLDIFDLFIRFLTVGQLSLLGIYVLSKSCNLKSVLATVFAVCLCSYILLTTPIADEHYGLLRGILLFFTEISPYIMWCFALSLVKDDFHPKNWPTFIKVLLALTLLWFLYFFGYLQGVGVFHQVNHAIQLMPLLHIIFISIKNLADDLVNTRRNIRMILVVSICLYFCFILALELGDSSLRDSPIFSLMNAFLALLSTSVFSWFYYKYTFKDEGLDLIKETNIKQTSSILDIPIVYKDVHQKLCQTMQDGFYMETQLTIKELSQKLLTPEHQLRELINRHLGFRNFSDYLNSYRLPAACAQLADATNIRKPILTIALELGYGSIATFNRAFKAKMGATPKEYRRNFQK